MTPRISATQCAYSIFGSDTMAAHEERGFVFETVQSIPFRTMTESLKDVIVDGVFMFSKNGVHLTSMDNTKSIVVQLDLHHQCIERYRCDATYVIGINMATFYKVIKTITTADTIMFVYSENRPYELEISINSIEKRSSNKYFMQLLKTAKMDDLSFEIDTFDTILQMQSYYFQKTCKDLMQTGGTHVRISTGNDRITFSSKDSLLQSELCLYETSEGMRFKKKNENEEEMIRYGTFSLKHLITFTKCTTLCPIVTLYLMPSMPLVLQYNVANLGIIRYCIASLDV